MNNTTPIDISFPEPKEGEDTITFDIHYDPSPEGMESKEKTRLVIIHDTDADGVSAAWCIKQGFSSEYTETVCIPQRAGINNIPEGLLPDDTVFLVDRTYPWITLIELSRLVFQVTVLDHHKSAKESLYIDAFKTVACNVLVDENRLEVSYNNIYMDIDLTHSACMLTWLYVVENDPADIQPPWFISYIEDRDMWWFKLPHSKEINAGMYHLGNTFENYDNWYSRCTGIVFRVADERSCAITGSIVLAIQQRIIEGIAHGPTVSRGFISRPDSDPVIDGTFNRVQYTTAVVCCPFSLISDLGDYMLNCTKEGFIKPDVVIVYNRDVEKGGYIYSIRSKSNMLWFAGTMGGGGHPNACGFTSDILLW